MRTEEELQRAIKLHERLLDAKCVCPSPLGEVCERCRSVAKSANIILAAFKWAAGTDPEGFFPEGLDKAEESITKMEEKLAKKFENIPTHMPNLTDLEWALNILKEGRDLAQPEYRLIIDGQITLLNWMLGKKGEVGKFWAFLKDLEADVQSFNKQKEGVGGILGSINELVQRMQNPAEPN